MDDIYNVIREYKPLITITTLNNYIQSLKKLFQLLNTEDTNILQDYHKVSDVISYMSDLSKRNVYNAIIVYLQATKTDIDIINKYVATRDVYNNDYIEFTKKNEKSPVQEANWLSEKEIDDTLEYQRVFNFQKYLLLRFLQSMPVRNDFRNLIIITKARYNKLTDDDKRHNNYFVKSQRPLSYQIALNNYKTCGSYGEKLLDIDIELYKDIGKFLRTSKHTSYLFTKLNGGPFNTIEFTKYVQSIFSRTGKKVGTTMLRHIFASLSGAEALAKQKKLANTMGHSLNMNTDYIKL
jgi:integrase